MDADRRRTPRSHRPRPYPAAVRASAVAALQEGLASGRSLTSLATEMALPVTTAQRWLACAHSAFRPVTIASAAQPASMSPAALVLCTSHGHRLEGLDVATAILA